MSDLCMYEFEDTIWNDLRQSDDHIVPRPLDDHSPFGDNHKKPRCEVTNISHSTEDRSSAGYDDQGSEEGKFSSLSKKQNRMLESESSSHAPSGVFSSSTYGDSTKEASSLASEKTTSSRHVIQKSKTDLNGNELCVDDTISGDRTTVYDNNSSTDPLCDITHTSNNLNFLENAEVKDSSDFLYYGWPEIENFEDVDRIFRSCDSTFGLGASGEDELDWFSSDSIGGAEEHENSNFKFSCPESNSVEDLSRNYDLKCHSSNDATMTSAPMKLSDSLWISEKPESYVSFMSGPAISNGEEGFTPKTQMNGSQKQVKVQNQPVGKQKEHNFENGSLDCTNKLLNEAVQLPSRAKSHQAFSVQQQPQHGSALDSCNYIQNHLSYWHPDKSPSSDLTSVNPTSSAVKTETNELASPSTRESSHASSLFPSMNVSHDFPHPVAAPTGTGEREKLHNHNGSQSLIDSNLKPSNVATSSNPGSEAKETSYTGDKLENHGDIEEVRHFPAAELGSSNIQESSTSSGMNNVSPEAASFHQLQLVMKQLDLRTKICIRDSLYRLARSAEQRHIHANLNNIAGDGRDASGALITEREKSFMDIETDTNPIDRSVAHLLFHRPSEASPASAQDLLPLKSPTT